MDESKQLTGDALRVAKLMTLPGDHDVEMTEEVSLEIYRLVQLGINYETERALGNE